MGLGTDLFLEFQAAVGKEVLGFFLEAIGCHPAIFPVNLDSDTVAMASHGHQHGCPGATERIEDGIPPPLSNLS